MFCHTARGRGREKKEPASFARAFNSPRFIIRSMRQPVSHCWRICHNRGDDLMRFGMQRAAVTNLESCEERRSEMQAYVALGDFIAADSVAQTAVAKEDRLHILAIIASAKKKKGIPVAPELIEQVNHLYTQIEKKGLVSWGVEIALDLLNCQPELAIDLVRSSQESGGTQETVDLALAHLSMRTLVEKAAGKDAVEACAKVRAQLQDPGVQKFVDTLSLLWGTHLTRSMSIPVAPHGRDAPMKANRPRVDRQRLFDLTQRALFPRTARTRDCGTFWFFPRPRGGEDDGRSLQHPGQGPLVLPGS